MIWKKISFALLLLFFTLCLEAQQPSHFILGESELSNINIYDLTQDNQGNYWLATDQGIIKYDGYHFTTIKNLSMMGTSVFALTFDSKQNLYCNNLSGQIFKIVNDKCTVHFQIPDSLMFNEIYFEFDEADNLIVATNAVFKVKPSLEIEMLYRNKELGSRFSILFKKQDQSLITYSFSSDELIEINKGKLKIQKLDHRESSFQSLQFIYLNDSLLYYNKLNSRILNKKLKKFNPPFIPNQKEGLYRLYSDNTALFVALPAGGMLLFNKEFSPLLEGMVIFENEIISSFHKDFEGNLLFGTFNGGIIVIPNLYLIDINSGSQKVKFTHITSANERIFVGTQDGRVLEINKNNKLTTFRKKQVKGIEGIKYIKLTNELLIDERFPLLINLETNKEQVLQIGAVKDIESIADSAYMIATNAGVYVYNPLQQIVVKNQEITVMPKMPKTYALSEFVGRTNAINFDLRNRIVYAATPQGLKMGRQNQVDFFKLKGASIISSDIQNAKDKIYVCTQNQGLLIFENGKLLEQWTTKTGLLSNTVNQIKIYNERLYISTTNGFQILSESGNVLHTLNPSDGLHNLGVIDFEVCDNTLWLVQQKGIQKIDLDKIKSAIPKPKVKLVWIIQDKDTISIKSDNTFSHEQSKFEFQVFSNTLKYQEELEYYYQLSGIDKDWQINRYKNNVISYLSLPAGTYVFAVKAVCRNQESETIKYTFTILPPYWNTWWFYLLSILLVLAVSGGIFTTFYIRQRKKIEFQNELNNSKLSAIQSQMNPHFIFNALNSIQDFIVLNEKKMASKYLGKFADLMRIYLNHSQIKTVSLREEIDALKLYLELEKLRFSTLEFTIDIDKHIDENLMAIPTLLIQPYVENSLKHGLLHKREDKKLSVSFKLLAQHQLIECEIIDNGIGRVASAEVNKMRSPYHKSFATKATKNRLELLNYGHKKPIGEQIFDLYDQNGKALGTKVILRIPILD